MSGAWTVETAAVPTALWIRHGSTRHNVEHRYQGVSALPLDPIGRAEADRLRETLTDRGEWGGPTDIVWTSDLPRARETAVRIFGRERVRIDERLREIRFGAIEGCTYDEARSRFGVRFTRWLADPDSGACLGVERYSMLEKRIADFLLDREPASLRFVVTHGGPLRALAELLSPWTEEPAVPDRVGNGSAVRIPISAHCAFRRHA